MDAREKSLEFTRLRRAENHVLILADQRANAERRRAQANLRDFEECLRGRRRLAICACKIRLDLRERLQRVGLADAAIGLHATRVARNPALRHTPCETDVDECVEWRNLHFIAKYRDRVFEQLAIHLIANRCDVPRLRFAKQVARAAQLKIAHRDAKSRTQHRELFHCVESLERFIADGAILRQHEVAIRAMLPTANTSAQLMEFSKAEHVRVVDDHRVRGRNIDARFDDRG